MPTFFACLAETRRYLPEGIDYGDWQRLSRIDLEDRYANAYGYLTDDDERRDGFLDAEHRLSKSFLLVKHLDECRPFADEIIFFQRVRKQILKSIPGRKPDLNLEKAVKDLVDDSLESEGVVDIFGVAGIETPDLSILDEEFLQTFKHRPQENLRLKLLEKLMREELQRRERRNIAKAKGLQEMLEDTLRKYHNRLIDAATVIQTMIEIRRRLEEDSKRAAQLGLSEEELAFYDAVAANAEGIYDQAFLCDLIHETVETIKKRLRVDWTQPHREEVRASVRAAVKRVLRRRGLRAEDLDQFVPRLMEQANALYKDWPLAA